MKTLNIIFSLLFSTVLFSGCSSIDQKNILSADCFFTIEPPMLLEAKESMPLLVADPISEVLFHKVPELDIISTFIQRQSRGQAHLLIYALDPIDLQNNGILYYPVYIGEEWDSGHRIHWYWFYVCENLEDVLVDLSYKKIDLEQWRENETFLRQMYIIQDALAGETYDDNFLDSWTGVYTYTENSLSDQKIEYTVTVYKIIDKLYSKIEFYGAQMHTYLFAKIQGDENKIDFIYDQTTYNWLDHFTLTLDQGDILFSFLKNEQELYTSWEALSSLPEPDREQNTISFSLDENKKNILIDNSEGSTNYINPDQYTMPEAIYAYNEFLNGRNFIWYNSNMNLIDNIMNIYNNTSDKKYTLYNLTGNGVPELILQSTRLYILSYNAGELSIWYTDERFGGSSYFVNGGNLYHRHGGMANKLMHAYEELDSNGDCSQFIGVTLYASYDDDTESWLETYYYQKDDDQHYISEKEYDELVFNMSNGDEIEWQEFIPPDSTIKLIR